MPSRAIIAVAGSGKTSTIVEDALAMSDRRVLITTYTIENLSQIRDYFGAKHGCVPPHVTLMSWYEFLLADGARPYQRAVTGNAPRIASLHFKPVPQSAYRWTRADSRYYMTAAADVYRDRLADLIVQANQRTEGAVVRRIQHMFDTIIVDEMQDLAGSDLDILHALMTAGLEVVCVGDPRQATFRTNNAQRNRKYRGAAIVEWLEAREAEGLLSISEQNECFRCVPEICDFANKLFADLPPAISRNATRTGHDGIVFVTTDGARAYYEKWKPMVLRNDRGRDTLDLPAKNFGEVKGRTYERVLIFPTQPMLKYLSSGVVGDAGDRSRFYVAVTRARTSVAFVRDAPKARKTRQRNTDK